jgi:thiazole/oxazole-forming peptide maturase SagD family component
VISGPRTFRADLGDRQRERRLVSALCREDAAPAPAVAEHSRSDPPLVVDLFGDGDAGAAALTAAPVVLAGRIDDPRIHQILRHRRSRQASTALAWTSGARVGAACDDGTSRPCVHCALLQDTTSFHIAIPARMLSLVEDAVRAGHWFEHNAAATGQARDLARWLASNAPLSPGEAVLCDVSGELAVREWFSPHPSCWCAFDAAAPRQTTPAIHQRLSPIQIIDSRGNGHPVRVRYRRSRHLAPLVREAFGQATAWGPAARVRAIAEAVERTAMLHAPPQLRDRSLRALAGLPVLARGELDSLLFTAEQHALPGFRFPRVDEELRLDWSWAEDLDGTVRALVPTSLIGRPSEHSARLVDATSNGYAAHPERDKAIETALLEVIERDAVLATWYARRMPLQIGAGELYEEASLRTFLVTQDIDLPVVWIVATLPWGGVRCGSAAAATVVEASTRARSEVIASVISARPPRSAIPNLHDVGRRAGPEDHARFYDEAANAAAAFQWLDSAAVVSIDEAGARWPAPVAPRSAIARAGLRGYWVDRSLPELLPGWHVARVLIPGLVELSWGHPYRRAATSRLEPLAEANPWPHPIA